SPECVGPSPSFCGRRGESLFSGSVPDIRKLVNQTFIPAFSLLRRFCCGRVERVKILWETLCPVAENFCRPPGWRRFSGGGRSFSRCGSPPGAGGGTGSARL